jgi:L-ribulose-5-phosphate 4-epimerase
MQPTDEGYIKYQCQWQKDEQLIPENLFEEIDPVRNLMMTRNLIGCYDDGIGFGNISIRDSGHPERFYITGSATGHIKTGGRALYALVERWDIPGNTLWSRGPVQASSESMSHAVIYETLPEVTAVIHIHHLEHWRRAIAELPATPEHIAYGTPEMAEAIRSVILEFRMKHHGVLAMKGHEEGMIMYGRSMEEAIQAFDRFTGRH